MHSTCGSWSEYNLWLSLRFCTSRAGFLQFLAERVGGVRASPFDVARDAPQKRAQRFLLARRAFELFGCGVGRVLAQVALAHARVGLAKPRDR
jgi:hypothetical protein